MALLGQMVAMLLFAFATNVPDLLIGRVVQGLATGAALGPIGAGMLDISRFKGTLGNAVVPGTGTGSSASISAVVVQYLPAPTHLICLTLLAIFAVQLAGVRALPETADRQSGALTCCVLRSACRRQ